MSDELTFWISVVLTALFVAFLCALAVFSAYKSMVRELMLESYKLNSELAFRIARSIEMENLLFICQQQMQDNTVLYRNISLQFEKNSGQHG